MKRKTKRKDDPRFDTLANVEPIELTYLWEPYIPDFSITLLEGDPNVGKTYISMAIAAAVSTGTSLPTQRKPRKGKVLIMSAEDDAAITLRPRVEAMGGNAKWIRYATELFVFNEDGLKRLERELKAHKPILVILDPLIAYMGTDTDLYRANQTRAFMAKLQQLASKYNCSVLAVRHLTKSSKDKSIYRGLGSIDIMAAVRSALLVGTDPDDAEIRIMAHSKHNLSECGTSRTFELRKVGGVKHPRLVWTGISDHGADALVAAQAVGRPPDQITAACEYLRELLDKPFPVTEIESQAKEIWQISVATLRRAKNEIGAIAYRKGGRWWWKLSDTQDDQN